MLPWGGDTDECSDGRIDQALDGAAEVANGAGDHPGQGDGDGGKSAASERHNRAQQWRGYWPNLAAKPTLRTALCGFTVDPLQPFAAMTHLNFELVRKSAGRSAAGGGYAANLIYNWIVQPPPIPQPLQPVQPQSNGSQ